MTLITDASAVAAWLMPDEAGYDLVGLALRRSGGLATADTALVRAAQAEGVTVV